MDPARCPDVDLGGQEENRLRTPITGRHFSAGGTLTFGKGRPNLPIVSQVHAAER